MSATRVSPILSKVSQKVLIHETFQNTIQGEGYWTGALVDFIRFYGCPVGCPWCDTGYAATTDQTKLPQQHRTIKSLTMTNLSILEGLGMSLIPVFTYKADFRHFEYMLENYEYIALGGLFDKPNLKKWLDACFF